jgi:hypothetical protein
MKWRIKHASDKYGFPLPLPKPDDNYSKSVIFENNKRFEVYPPFGLERDTIIACENKPRDMPIYGIFFEPVLRNEEKQ